MLDWESATGHFDDEVGVYILRELLGVYTCTENYNEGLVLRWHRAVRIHQSTHVSELFVHLLVVCVCFIYEYNRITHILAIQTLAEYVVSCYLHSLVHNAGSTDFNRLVTSLESDVLTQLHARHSGYI